MQSTSLLEQLLMPEGKGSVSYWQMWSIFLGGEWICSTAEFVWFEAAQKRANT
jgi:hypothetical protein